MHISNKAKLLCAGVMGAAALFASSTADAAIVTGTLLEDRFIDGARTNGADALDTAWWLNASNPVMSIESDSTTGINEGSPDNALQYASTSGSTFRGFHGVFSPLTTLAVGDGLRLSLDYRYTADPAAAYNAATTKEGFKIGLYNTDGAAATADNSSADANDDGYFTFLTNNGTIGSTLRKEIGDGVNQPGSGSDNVIIGSASAVAMPSQGTTSHTAVLELLYTATNNMEIRAIIDGTTILNVVDTSASPLLSFNEVFIGQGGHFGTFRVDNVIVETLVVPEPASLSLLGLGGLAALRRRRVTA